MKDSTIVEQIRNNMLALESSLRDFNCLHNKYDTELVNETDFSNSLIIHKENSKEINV